jgi:hypothetical protein
VHAVLDRHGLVQRGRQRRRHKAQGTPPSAGRAANDLWCTDFKGELKLGNGRYRYPWPYDLGCIDLQLQDTANHRQPVRREVVTHVLGTNRYPCLRNGPQESWRALEDSNLRPAD